MKKILLCCIVVVLTMIICVVPSFAAAVVASSGSFTITAGDYDIIGMDNEFTDGLMSDGSCVVFSCAGYAIDSNSPTADHPFDGIVFNAPDAVDGPPGQWTLYNGDVELLLDYGVTLHFTSPLITYEAVGDITHEQIVAGFNDYIGPVHNPVTFGVFESVGSAFSTIFAWLPASVVTLIGIFWTGSALTPIGVLSVAGLSIGVILLIFSIISRFLKFRG